MLSYQHAKDFLFHHNMVTNRDPLTDKEHQEFLNFIGHLFGRVTSEIKELLSIPGIFVEAEEHVKATLIEAGLMDPEPEAPAAEPVAEPAAPVAEPPAAPAAEVEPPAPAPAEPVAEPPAVEEVKAPESTEQPQGNGSTEPTGEETKAESSEGSQEQSQDEGTGEEKSESKDETPPQE